MTRPGAPKRCPRPASLRVSRPRRRALNLEVTLIYALRDLHRAEDQAQRDYNTAPSRENLEAWNRATRNLQRNRAARKCATRVVVRAMRHELSLTGLRDGCDAYALKRDNRASRRVRCWRPKFLPKPDHRDFTERGDYAASRTHRRPADLLLVNVIGAHAPPTVVLLTSTSERGPAT